MYIDISLGYTMKSNVYRDPIGLFGVPPKKYKITKNYRRGPLGEFFRAQYGEHQPMMYLTTTDEDGSTSGAQSGGLKKKTVFCEQQITLTTAFNKGRVYPYNSTKRGWVD